MTEDQPYGENKEVKSYQLRMPRNLWNRLVDLSDQDKAPISELIKSFIELGLNIREAEIENGSVPLQDRADE